MSSRATPRSSRNLAENSEPSTFQDENLLYVQPTRARPMVYNRPYKKPIQKIASNTIYSLSYKKYDCKQDIPKMRIDFGKYEKMLRRADGKIDFDTVYKLSYPANPSEELRKPFVHKPCLSINGCHDMSTTHKLSYANPGYVKTTSYKPYGGKPQYPVPMERKTIAKESYQHFGAPIIQRPRKHQFWQTKFKTNYQTTNRLSYQYVKPFSKMNHLCYKPKISAKIQKDTVYSTSYQIPGHFIAKVTSA